MPIYIYKCPVCENVEEHLVSLSDELNQIKRCYKHKPDQCILMEKQITTPACFILKGAGFYKPSH